MKKFLIFALLVAGCMCIHHNWEPIYGKESARTRRIQCFKTCHMTCCYKRQGQNNPACSKDQSGREYPADYAYEPPTSAFENHKDDKVAMEYLNKRNQ